MESRVGPDMTEVRVLVQFPCFGSNTDFFQKNLNDSAWLCMEKLKKHDSETQKLKDKINNLKIKPKNPDQD